MIRVLASVILVLSAVIMVIVWPTAASNQVPAVKVEGCVACHGLIEPMHKYGTTETLEKLKDGKDAVGLSCTACHGGNPVARTKEEAHVRPVSSRVSGDERGNTAARIRSGRIRCWRARVGSLCGSLIRVICAWPERLVRDRRVMTSSRRMFRAA